MVRIPHDLDEAFLAAEEHLRWELDQARAYGRGAHSIYSELLDAAEDHNSPSTWPHTIDALLTLWCRAQLGA